MRDCAQISCNVTGFAQVVKEGDTEENIDMILTSTAMLDSIILSSEDKSTLRYSGLHSSTVGAHSLTVTLVQYTGASLIVPTR